MGTGGGFTPRDSWTHSVTLENGKFVVDGNYKPVTLRNDKVIIGSTTVSRTAVEALVEFWKKHFPVRPEAEVEIQ